MNKSIKTIIFLLVFIFISTSTQAQFLKTLKDKAKQKIEQEAERRAQKRVDKKIDKTFDEAEEKIDGKIEKKKKNNTTNLPANYNFEWEYILKMESEKKKKNIENIKIAYYLNANSSAFGSKFEMKGKDENMGDIITVIDFEKGINLMFMEMNGQKIIQKMPSIFNPDVDDVVKEQESKNYTIIKTDSKIILGYQCQGFKITNDDGIINMYVAKNAPITFNGVFKGNSKFNPKGFNPVWLKELENGLMMEMQFISSKKQKYNMKMTCISLKETPFTINLGDYKSFGF